MIRPPLDTGFALLNDVGTRQLIASHEYPKAARAEILDNFMATVLRGVAPR